MELNKEMRDLYKGFRHEHFTAGGSDDCSYLTHTKSSLSVELPSVLAEGATTHVNIEAHLCDARTPEEVMGYMQSLMQQRDYLRELGYHPFERFERYADGVEYVYDIPTESLDTLVRILCDLGECGNLGKKEGK